MKNQICQKNQEPYYIGVDIGTNSVGYAVADTDYKPCKFKGDPMLGVTLFDDAKQCVERRGFRTARRRLDRRQQRVDLVAELLAPEIIKADPTFFVRIKESYLQREDRLEKSICGIEWDNDEYRRKFPTVHHLICTLMNSASGLDIRHIYIAIAWLVAHRGHFLNNTDGDKVNELTDMEPIYKSFEQWFDDNGYDRPWKCNVRELEAVLSKSIGVKAKHSELKELLFGGKSPDDGDEALIRSDALLNLFAGGKVKLQNLFYTDEYKESTDSICLDDPDGIEALLPELGDNSEIIMIASSIYDCAKLSALLGDNNFISEVKVSQYDEHRKDLKELKYLIRKYCPSEYGKMFRRSESNDNYSSYVGNFKSYRIDDEKKDAPRDSFYKYVKKVVSAIETDCDGDGRAKEDILNRIEIGTYMLKQVNPDNRIIPNQLYYAELKAILEKAEREFPFFTERDEDGLSVSDKIISVFQFRVPYYVGPLVSKQQSQFAWLERKAEGRILPWNFDLTVDSDACEEAFIRRMTNKCTYLPNEDVIPKSSLLYSKFEILNAINNIKINERNITVEQKQEIFEKLFKNLKKVTYKRITEHFAAIGATEKDNLDAVSGIDVQFNMSYKPYLDFKNLLGERVLSEEYVEELITRLTYTEDKKRFKKWLESWVSDKGISLSQDDIKYISSKKYSEFGRLSRELLNGIEGARKDTGEIGTVMHFMWNTNDNLMQIITDGDKYTFAEKIAEIKREYYSQRGQNVSEQLDSMGISNAVKRPVIRTLDIIDDIIKVKKYPPKKIFVEMARGATEEQKKQGRTTARRDQLLALYKGFDQNEINEIKDELERLGENANKNLQSESLYLYFAQLGKCMYCGKPIDDLSQCDIDHIWPRSRVKDDSVHNNKVLVHKSENGKKSDQYPIPEEWRNKMHGFWKHLNENKAINDEKFSRLTRRTPFTDDEMAGFINRQIVETRQSTKIVTQLLQEKYSENGTRIVFVKAGNVSDFRHKYGIIKDKAFKLDLSDGAKRAMSLVKSRTADDIHHAYDAYLNIVVGNVYDERFSKQFFKIGEEYTLNEEAVFGRTWDKDPSVWNPSRHLPMVDRVLSNRNVRLTKYQVCQRGGFYDQMPLSANKNKNGSLIPLKNDLDPSKYGGYNKPTVSFYVLVRYKNGKKYELTVLPVELRIADRYLNDTDFADRYIKEKLGDKADDISKPLGNRILRINTLFSLDGFEVCLAGKSGDKIILRSMMTPRYSDEWTAYIKRLENVSKKLAQNPSYEIDERYDGISKERNIEFYDYLVGKMNGDVYSKMPGARPCVCNGKREMFDKSDIKQQKECLENMVLYLKTNRSGSCNMKSVGGGQNEGTVYISKNIKNLDKKYKDVHIIDRSPSGLFESSTVNLLELLK